MHMTFLSHTRQRGVSLIEVLVALLVIAVGVLGLSKMQALAISNSQVSGVRGVVAMQAASLAATMHSDKAYWQVLPAGTTPPCTGATACVLTGTTVPSSFGAVPSSCVKSARCLNGPMTAWDISNWMTQMNTLVPGYTATIDCANSATLPVVCSIEIVWIEKQAGGGTTSASLAAATPGVSQAFYLYVQP